VPGVDRNAATWDNNVGSFFEGANIVAFSSQNNTSLVPANAIDDNVSSRWASAQGATTGQFLTLGLPGGRSHTVTAVRIVNADGTGGQSIKNFLVQVSNTTADDAAFTTVLTDAALDNNRVQEFVLSSPVEARYVKLVPIDNWGSTCCVGVKSFEVIERGLAGVPSHFVLPANAALASELGRIVSFSSQGNTTSLSAANLIDGNVSSRWSTLAPVRTGNVVIELGKGKTYLVDRVRLVNAAGTNTSVRNFRVDVSATTPDDAGFSTVVTAVALDNSTLQEFVFPAGPRDARYVRLVAVDAYGTGTSVSVNELQVVPVPTPVTSYSSYQDATNRPENLLDNSNSTYWLTASGQVTNQFVELDLGGETLLDRVRLQPSTFVTAENARDFDVLVSTTTDADAAFTKVLSATVANAGTLQEFLLPAPARARFVRLLVKNNYGSATLIRLATFEAVAVRSEGNIVTLPAAPTDVTGLESPSLIANGATVVAFSSQFDVNHSPANMLDYVAGNPWATRAPLLPGPHFVTIQLGGTALHNLVGIKISGRVDQAFTQSVKDFEVWVSSTTADDTAFTRVLTGTVVNDQSLQTFLFPGGAVPARYVKYVPKNNYGDPNNLSTSNFEVLTTTAGGVVSATTFSAYSNRPEFVLDGSSSTAAWRTRTGSVTNQSITLRLSGGTSHPLYGVSVWPEGGFGPKDYEIQVSNTTADDAAFTTVATGVLTSTDARREIPFNALTPATYVRFLWKTGLSTSFIGVRELEALEPPAAGAVVLAVSSENSTSFPVQRALDIDRISTGWITGNNLNTNQFVKILLPRAALWVVDHVALQGRDCCADQAPRDFDVQVSTTTFDDAAFTTVFTGTLRNDFSLQHFYFPPTPARAIRLLLKNAYGSTVIGVQTFWAFSPQLGGVNARFLDRSRAVDGALAGYDWDFGDGAHSSARDPEHLYAGPGIFNVALTVTDANGLTSTQTRSYQVFGAAAPDFTFSPTAASEGANVNFTDISPDPFGIGYREWAWGDGTANTVNTSPVGHVFADNGAYPVTLRVLNNRGLSAETTKTVTVSNVAPTVDAGPNQTVVWNQVWAISPSVNDAGTVDRNSLVCTWDFGDGQTAQVTACNSSNARVNHAYANPGTYTATLTVRDKENATASDFLTVTVNKRPTLLNIYAALSSTSAGAVEVAAKLVDRFDVTQAMPGQSVVFTLGTQTVPVTTNAEGIAVAVLTFAPGVVNTVTATYAGDTFYVPAADTDSFNPVSVFPETPSLRNDQSEIVALVPSDSGRVANGGVLSTVGFAGGYAPLILVVDPLVVADATKANPLPGFDTVALNGICDIGSNQFLGNATFRNRVQDFVVRGGKLIIWDSECQNTDYSKFFLPFTTNNPGALGANGTLQDVEENSLSSSDPASPAFVNVGFVSTQTDAVGDANVFLTFDPNWCVDMKAKNAVLPDFKPVHTYAVLGRGLLIYNGLDRDAMQSNASASPNTGSFFLARIWERELKQPWNPSGLPCDVAATQATIVLAPTSATLDVGQTHTVTATVTDVNGTPIRSVFVNLVVTGANPFTQQGTTNDSGVATFTYTGTHLGDDVLVAGAGAIQSNSASAHWNAAPIANAGDDQLVGTGSVVVLDGSRSSDPNPGDVLTYAWRQLSGPVVTLDDPASVHPRFTPTEAGDHVFELRVSDGRLSATDTVKITAEIRNRPPVAQDQAVATDEDVPLAIVLGATDPDGDALTYTLLSSPAHGTLTGTAPNLTYTPAANYNGPDGFTFKAATPSSARTSRPSASPCGP
jgi:PKD repeat protein